MCPVAPAASAASASAAMRRTSRLDAPPVPRTAPRGRGCPAAPCPGRPGAPPRRAGCASRHPPRRRPPRPSRRAVHRFRHRSGCAAPSRCSTSANTRSECGQHEFPVIGERQRAGPRVEQLDRVDAGAQLGLQEGDGGVGEACRAARATSGVGVHQRLRALVIAARTALDQVRGEGERGSGEADQRRRAEFGGEQLHGLRDGADLFRHEARQGGDVGDRPDRVRDDGTGAGDDVEIDTGGLERHHDVGEQDRGVDAVPAHRLHRDLADQLPDRSTTRASRSPPGSRGTRASERPACRMNHTGRRLGGTACRAAARNGASGENPPRGVRRPLAHACIGAFQPAHRSSRSLPARISQLHAAMPGLRRRSALLGAPPTRCAGPGLTSRAVTTSGSPAEPAEFRAAVEAMNSAQVRAGHRAGPHPAAAAARAVQLRRRRRGRARGHRGRRRTEPRVTRSAG